MNATTMDIAHLGPVSAHIASRLRSLLDEHGVVVIYDGQATFRDLLTQLESQLHAGGYTLISTERSNLRARRSLDETYRKLGAIDGPHGILVYVPRARHADLAVWREDLFAAYATVGAAFGVQEAEQLQTLARAALPDHAAAIERQFNEGKPTIASLDAIGGSNAALWPSLQQVFGSGDPVRIIVQSLTVEDLSTRLDAMPGAASELSQLLSSTLGVPTPHQFGDAGFVDSLLAFLLLAELEHSIPGGMPPALTSTSRASAAAWALTSDVLAALRDSASGRLILQQRAPRIEATYKLANALQAAPDALGSYDTFPLQDRLRFDVAVKRALSGDLDKARDAAGGGESSIWRQDLERSQRWRALDRMLAFLETARACEADIPSFGKSVRDIVSGYVSNDGVWKLDRAHRLAEQAMVECQFDESMHPLLDHCRQQYRHLLAMLQDRFQPAVRTSGWPPVDLLRQTQVFNRFVSPELDTGQRVAYFQVDSLRYELGRDLAAALEDLGTSSLSAAMATLPTSTPIGMASLLPDADGSLSLVSESAEKLTPAIGDHLLPDLNHRRDYLKNRFGDRVAEIQLEQVISAPPSTLKKLIGAADLLVVRSLEIDDAGEGRSITHVSPLIARVIGDIKRAVDRLVEQGFRVVVAAADHGHLLLPDIPPGDVIPEPEGTWHYRKRRSLVGTFTGKGEGSIVIGASSLGVQTEPTNLDLAFSSGLRTYRQGEGYFHEGLSLQECIVPVIVFRGSAPEPLLSGTEQVVLSYKSTTFTSSVIGLQAQLLNSMFSPTLNLRIEAFDGSGAKAKRVGNAADCDARDPVTGEIALKANETIQVPILINPEFAGDQVEVRAIDPKSNTIYHRLPLKNGRLD